MRRSCLLLVSLLLFFFPQASSAEPPAPCSEDVAKILTDNGLTRFESVKVCYVAKYYKEQNPQLSGEKAIQEALKRLGLKETMMYPATSGVTIPRDPRERPAAESAKASRADEETTTMKWEIRAWDQTMLGAQWGEQNSIWWVSSETNGYESSRVRQDPFAEANERTWIDPDQDKDLFEMIRDNVGVLFGVNFKF